MIASLEGSLLAATSDGAVIDVHGVGYRLLMSTRAIGDLPQVGSKVRMQTHLHVREDALTLYGFATPSERDLFVVLLTVAGIGPKGALAVLSVYSPDAFRKAVATEDLEALTLIPGVGKKTAARMVLELREKLALPELDGVPGGTERAAQVEVKGALISLGYSVAEAREALERVPHNGHDYSSEELLRLTLRELART